MPHNTLRKTAPKAIELTKLPPPVLVDNLSGYDTPVPNYGTGEIESAPSNTGFTSSKGSGDTANTNTLAPSQPNVVVSSTCKSKINKYACTDYELGKGQPFTTENPYPSVWSVFELSASVYRDKFLNKGTGTFPNYTIVINGKTYAYDADSCNWHPYSGSSGTYDSFDTFHGGGYGGLGF
jgi:hypothetical protein